MGQGRSGASALSPAGDSVDPRPIGNGTDSSTTTFAQKEKRTDLLLSTLRNYVEAMDGELRLTVEIPGKPGVPLGALCGIEPDSRRHRGQR